MRRLAMIGFAVVVVACGGAQDQADTAADSAAAVPAGPPPLTAADLAGTWNMQAMAEGSDSVLTTYTLNATTDTNGWTQTFPGRAEPIPLQVLAIAGDSIVLHAGPYESVLRPGVQVTTHTVARLQGGMIVGTGVARYTTTGPDSVLNIRFRGTRQ